MTRSTEQQPGRPVFDEVLSEGIAYGQEFSVVAVSAGSLASGGAPKLIGGLPVGQVMVAVEGPWFEGQVEAAWQRAVEEATDEGWHDEPDVSDLHERLAQRATLHALDGPVAVAVATIRGSDNEPNNEPNNERGAQ